nr:C40 family peptidase [Bacillus horti]
MFVNVSVATVWTDPKRPRSIDQLNLQSPVDIEAWLGTMTTADRLELCERNIIQSQVLYGQKVIVTEEKEEWAHVWVPGQPSKKQKKGYPGWIPKKQLSESNDINIDVEFAESFIQVKSKQATIYLGEDSSGLQKSEKSMELSFQTRLPYIKEDTEWVYVRTLDGIQHIKKEEVHRVISSTVMGRKESSQFIELFRSDGLVANENAHNGQLLVGIGKQFLGLPYLWGGVSSFGYDCSGFVYSMHQALGTTIPRDASDQAKAGKQVDLEQLETGDLLFFAYEEGKGAVHHVGIYVEEGQMLHSPKTGKTIEIIPLAGTLYEKELCVARRFWE